MDEPATIFQVLRSFSEVLRALFYGTRLLRYIVVMARRKIRRKRRKPTGTLGT